MSFEFNPADEDPHGECRHHIQEQAAKMRDQQERIAFLEKDVAFLRQKNNSLQIDLDLANCGRRDAIDALEAFQGYDGDEELWAAMKRERDEAVAQLTEARRLLNLSLFDVLPHSQRARDIEAFLRETQPAPTIPQTDG